MLLLSEDLLDLSMFSSMYLYLLNMLVLMESLDSLDLNNDLDDLLNDLLLGSYFSLNLSESQHYFS